jgi:hypothetical protein
LLKVITTLTDQIYVPQTLPDNSRNRRHKAIPVVSFPLVEAEGLLVEIPKQMKRLDVNVGALDRALEQAPEIFETVGVHLRTPVQN